jgi:hypothetical protein
VQKETVGRDTTGSYWALMMEWTQHCGRKVAFLYGIHKYADGVNQI